VSQQRRHRRAQAHRLGEEVRRPSVGPVAIAVGVVAVLAVAVILLAGPGAAPAGSLQPSSSGPAGSVIAVGSPSPSVVPGSTAVPSPSPSGATTGAVPIVPVVDFRSTETSVNAADVTSTIDAGTGRYEALELVASDADAILAALGVSKPASASRLILAKDAATLATDLARHRSRLAFLRAAQVTPAVRALSWGAKSLFGVAHVSKASDWPLNAELPAPADGSAAFDPGAEWTIVAAGDIMLDRGVAKVVKIQGKGSDFPFNGGTATITGRTCCSALHNPVPVTRRTGKAGAMRDLLTSADLTVANFENPAPDAFRYHTKGTIFSADPSLIAGLKKAGFDVVSIGNNHIRDAGAQGILDTIKNLKKYGIKSTGAGANLAAARKPAVVDVNGVVKVAILGYDTIAKYYAAGPSSAGSAQLTKSVVKADIKKARTAGADVVIVYPHWGTEYSPRPFAAQQALARAIIDAGADMVIGNHAHWVGAMEVYKGRPIWYALGNFVFDQDWSEPTMEGITLELTFRGSDLVQARMRPHVILDKSQPNFMDPAGTGRVVMGQLYDASRQLLPW
jgi:poly-gamma-glutamate capsule biosynthesis protein CapA/YwtB (metallophosphatase superfamily)